MLSVIIPTLNAEHELTRTFLGLMPALVDGMIREVIIVDAGSTDRTVKLADDAGAHIIHSAPNRGGQMKKGAAEAKADWLLFLHADTELERGWHNEATTAIEQCTGKHAMAFTFKLDDNGFAPRILEFLVALRSRIFGLPYGDQGLLISRKHYTEIGGYSELPLMEDVDIVRRMQQPVKILRSKAITSAARFRRDGYLKRSLKNLKCLAAYYRGTPIDEIKALYDQPASERKTARP